MHTRHILLPDPLRGPWAGKERDGGVVDRPGRHRHRCGAEAQVCVGRHREVLHGVVLSRDCLTFNSWIA